MSGKLMGAAAVIANHECGILLVKHSYGKNNWDLPGGKSEVNESAQETSKREALEEIGVHLEIEQLTGIYYDPQYDMHHFVFRAAITEHEAPKPSSPEILECGYFSIDALPKPISDFTVQRIHDAIKPNAEQLFHTIGPRKWIE